ncbi:hypothetical protein [Aquibacillus rhizosphaerae]|uniref:DUF2871 family protein n=1 Tax=Aquibacillus rhizosphaerae TaxID=3051431 RepID=A0ABT7L8H1_9BACI|nr:hypothetical protein [Aquibacillus sp. LR5S19]MDL4842162.1 hypothetical protein [Aquibacillus sp. LR5S19]
MYLLAINSFHLSNIGLFSASQLVPFGVTEDHLFFILGLLGIIICYYLLHPLIKLLVMLQWSSLLTYIFGSLIFLIITGLYSIMQHVNRLGDINLSKLANVALGITFFGGALFVIHLCMNIINYYKQHKSKSV